MANQAVGFGALLAGGVLITAAITGASLTDVATGKASGASALGGGTDTAAATQTSSRGGGGSGKPGKPGNILELIFNDGAGGFGIKNGQDVQGSSVFSAVWAGHRTHVHVAADPDVVIMLGEYAQSIGLHVGENPHFGGVDSGAHVPDSYHNTGRAIDVSGDGSTMARFARAVDTYNKTGKLP